jgi:hypothetical protein
MRLWKKWIFVLLWLSASASSVLAADVSIKGNLSEAVEGSDNEFLVNSPSGSTLKTTTTGTLDVLAQTPTTSYLLNTNYSYYDYMGPGTADTSLTWGTPASTTFTATHSTLLSKFTFGASWTRADVAQTQFEQTGLISAHGTINTYNTFASVSHDFSRLDTVVWSAQASTVSFTDSSQTPYADVNSTLSWNHTLTRETTWTNSLYFDSFSEDDAAKSQRLFWRLQSGLQTQLTPLLSVHGDIDLVFANSYQENSAAALPPPPTPSTFAPQVGAGHAIFGDVGLSYKPTKTTTVSLTAAQTVIPTFTGQLQQSQTIGLTASHEINEASSVSFFAQYAKTQTPSQLGQTGLSTDFWTASVNYNYRLTRDWRTSLSYTYRQREDITGLASSNTMLLTLSRDFNILGNPAAINEADAERSRQRAQQAVGEVFPNYQ